MKQQKETKDQTIERLKKDIEFYRKDSQENLDVISEAKALFPPDMDYGFAPKSKTLREKIIASMTRKNSLEGQLELSERHNSNLQRIIGTLITGSLPEISDEELKRIVDSRRQRGVMI